MTPEERRAAMRKVYGDAQWIPWVPPERIEDEIAAMLAADPLPVRFFLNRKRGA